MNSLKFIAVAAFVAGIATGFAADRSIRQKGKVFSETEVSLKKGETLIFVNDDNIAHNVLSTTPGQQIQSRPDPAGTFDAGDVQHAGQRRHPVRDPPDDEDDGQSRGIVPANPNGQAPPMSIRSKLLLAFGVVCLLSAGAALYSIRQVSALSSLVTQLYDGPLMAVSYARSAHVNFTQARSAVEEAIVMQEPMTAERIASIEKSMQQFVSDMAVVQERMGEAARAGDSIKKILDAANTWFRMGMAHLKPPSTGLRELAPPQAIVKEGRAVSAAIEALVENASAYGFNFRSDADTAVESVKSHLVVLAAATVLIGLIFAFGSAYSLTRPLRALTAGMKELGEGNFAIKLPGVGRRDEIGAIAGAVEAFKIKAEARAAEDAQRQLDEMAEQEQREVAERRRIEDERRSHAEAQSTGHRRAGERAAASCRPAI